MNRSKAAGTAAESAVVKWLHAKGWPDAKRITLHGSDDQGDVWVTRSFIIEVKVRGPRSSNAGLGQPGDTELEGWLQELEVEMENSGAKHGFLIVKRKGTTDPGRWWAYTRLGTLVPKQGKLSGTPVCLNADAMLEIIGRRVKNMSWARVS